MEALSSRSVYRMKAHIYYGPIREKFRRRRSSSCSSCALHVISKISALDHGDRINRKTRHNSYVSRHEYVKARIHRSNASACHQIATSTTTVPIYIRANARTLAFTSVYYINVCVCVFVGVHIDLYMVRTCVCHYAHTRHRKFANSIHNYTFGQARNKYS